MSTCRVHMQISSEAVARQLRVNRGAVVQTVAPNSAAAKAGLLPTRRALSGIVAGDTIVRIDSKPVAKPGKPSITVCIAKITSHCALQVSRMGNPVLQAHVDHGSEGWLLRRGPSPGIG